MLMYSATPDAIRETVQAARHFRDVMGKWADQVGETLVDADPATRADVLRRLANAAAMLGEVTAFISDAFEDASLPTDDGDPDDHRGEDGGVTSLNGVVGALGVVDSALSRIADKVEDNS